MEGFIGNFRLIFQPRWEAAPSRQDCAQVTASPEMSRRCASSALFLSTRLLRSRKPEKSWPLLLVLMEDKRPNAMAPTVTFTFARHATAYAGYRASSTLRSSAPGIWLLNHDDSPSAAPMSLRIDNAGVISSLIVNRRVYRRHTESVTASLINENDDPGSLAVRNVKQTGGLAGAFLSRMTFLQVIEISVDRSGDEPRIERAVEWWLPEFVGVWWATSAASKCLARQNKTLRGVGTEAKTAMIQKRGTVMSVWLSAFPCSALVTSTPTHAPVPSTPAVRSDQAKTSADVPQAICNGDGDRVRSRRYR